MSQIGPDYTYNTDSTIPAATRRKLIILAKKDPEQAAVVAQLIGYGDSIPGLNISKTKDEALQKFDKYTRNQIQTQFAQELAICQRQKTTQANNTSSQTSVISSVVESITDEIDEFSESVTNFFDASEINKTMKPVSTAVGSTLGTLTGVLKDPLGSITLLPQTLVDVVSKFNPEFAAKLEATFKSEKMKSLANLPNQIMGSINNLITKIDEALAVPLAYISDLYFGLMDLMDAIGDLVDSILTSVQNFIFGPGGLLDGTIFSEILDFLDALGEFAGEIGGISTIFLGANSIANFTNSLQNYTNQLGSFLSNPVDLLTSYLPSEVSQGLYLIRNPQQLINSILPPELSELTSTISKITGVGFNGNMGYGLASVLEGLKDGVLRSILTNFANQYGILTPLLASSESTKNTQNSTQTPTVESSPVNPAVTVVKQGIPQPQTAPSKVVEEIDEATSSASAVTGTLSRASIITGQASSASTASNNSGLKLQDFGDGEVYIVDEDGQVVREANATEIATGVIQ